MTLDIETAIRIGRRHGLSLADIQAMKAMSADEAEADAIAASFAGNATASFDDALRRAVKSNQDELR